MAEKRYSKLRLNQRPGAAVQKDRSLRNVWVGPFPPGLWTATLRGRFANISAWHQRHVQYISNIKNLADMGSAAAKDVPSGVILLAVTFFVFFTGSDGMLRWLQEKAATIKWDLLASGSTKNFATISGDALQIPMQQKIHVNTWYLASRSDAMLLDEELESEDEIANVENIRPFRGAAAAAAQALRHACLCRLAKQKLQELPGMKGSGYALKNLALLLRDICKECPYLGDKVSSGGPGLRQCYNLQSGCEEETFDGQNKLFTVIWRLL